MLRSKAQIYTVYEKADAPEPSDRIVLVREGFSLWAFIFTVFWLAYHRCWRAALLVALVLIALERGNELLGLSEVTTIVLRVGFSLWLGCAANDIRRDTLARRGFTEIDIVAAESELLAERRYFDRVAYRPVTV